MLSIRKVSACVLLAAVFSFFPSCTEFLDIKPYGKTIPETPEEFSALLNMHLRDIDLGEANIVGNVISVSELEFCSDNLEANLTQYPGGSTIPLYMGTLLNRKQYYYAVLYERIRDCNIILDNMKDDGSDMARNVIGTAYAIRGVCYYNLLRNFCEPATGNLEGLGVPLATRFDMEDRLIRSTIGQTAELCVSDMQMAISKNIDDKMFRFNSDVMEGYLARVFFWIGDWENALLHAQKILDRYPLIQGGAYQEMIESRNTAKGNVILKSGIIFDSNMQLQYNGTFGSYQYRPLSKKFIDLFEEGDRDIRYGLTIGKRRIAQKYPASSLRSAEMQLVKAESLFHLGKETDALAALNELRRNRIESYVPYTPSTLPAVPEGELVQVDCYGKKQTPLLHAILSERRKELFNEGDRWYELKRNGRPEFWTARHGRKYTTFRFMYTWPLPVKDISLVEGLVQNPGYDKVQ